jgi:D-alanyl-lipoteichoic acid acyltransferase DltB (MBOAT superfamily)
MLFNTPEFFAFLVVVLGLYYALARRWGWQNRMLLVASYLFYAAWDWRFLGVMLFITGVNFLAGRLMFDSEDPRQRKRILALAVATNLGTLCYFKYVGFFAESATRLLDRLGLPMTFPMLHMILPLGISFYTFHTMAYSIDIYRGDFKPVRSMRDFALYVSYFPQLVAGPIVRPTYLLPQLQAPRAVTPEKVATGLALILIGLFRKVVIADGLGLRIDPVFRSPATHTSPELLMALCLFALQIYCDFAGYTDIARGVSRLMGIELWENFRQPYFSANISEFWTRWHISLSTWLRDYLYIPLGGNRHGQLRTYANLMITMLLGGLWHGAAWTFVIWGGLHGTYLVVYHAIRARRGLPGRAEAAHGWQRLAGMAVTFPLVLLTWVFFRSPGLASALEFLRQLFAFQGMATLWLVLPAIAAPWLLSLAVDVPQFLSGEQAFLVRWRPAARFATAAVMLLLVLIAFGARAPFIYFQF